MAEEKIIIVKVDGLEKAVRTTEQIEENFQSVKKLAEDLGLKASEADLKKLQRAMEGFVDSTNRAAKASEGLDRKIDSVERRTKRLSLKSFAEQASKIAQGDAFKGGFLGGLLSGGITSAIDLAVTALWDWINAESEATKQAKMMIDAQNAAIESFADEKVALDTNISILQDSNATLEERQNAYDSLNAIYPEYFSNLSLEEAQGETLLNIYDSINNSIQKQIELKSQQTIAEKNYTEIQENLNKIETLRVSLEQSKNSLILRTNGTTNLLAASIKTLEDRNIALNKSYQNSISILKDLTKEEQESQKVKDDIAEKLKKEEEERKAREEALKRSREESKKSNEEFLKEQQKLTASNIAELESQASLVETQEELDAINKRIESYKRLAEERFKLSEGTTLKTSEELQNQKDINAGIILENQKTIKELQKELDDFVKEELESPFRFDTPVEETSVYKDLSKSIEEVTLKNEELIKTNEELTKQQRVLFDQQKKYGADAATELSKLNSIQEKASKSFSENQKKTLEELTKARIDQSSKLKEILESFSLDIAELTKIERDALNVGFDNLLTDFENQRRKFVSAAQGFTSISLDIPLDDFSVPEEFIANINRAISEAIDAGNRDAENSYRQLLSFVSAQAPIIKKARQKLAIDLANVELAAADIALSNLQKKNKVELREREADLDLRKQQDLQFYEISFRNLENHLKNKKESNQEFNKEDLQLILNHRNEVTAALEIQKDEELAILDLKYAEILAKESSKGLKAVKIIEKEYKLQKEKIIEGLDDQIQAVTDKSDQLIDSLGDPIQATASEIINEVTNIVSIASQIIGNIFDLMIQQSQNAIDSLNEQISAIESRIAETTSNINELESDLEGKRSGRREAILRAIELEKQREAELTAQKIELARKLEEENSKMRKRQKAAAITQAIINGALAMTNIAATLIDPTPVQAFRIAALVATAALTATQVALIASQKFAKGGFTSKNSHLGEKDETGFRVAGVVHEGEWVAPKWMVESPRFSDAISALEASRKSKGFAEGGFTTPANFTSMNSAINNTDIMNRVLSTAENALRRTEELANRPIIANPVEFTNISDKIIKRINKNTIGG